MSDEKKTPEEKKDKELKKLSKELLNRQITESDNAIEYARQNIVQLTTQLHQQEGVRDYAKHLLAQFELPEKVEEAKKKTDLEVK